VNNAQKNVSRGILIAMALAVAAYLSLTVLFFAAISPNTGFAENFNIQI
jgi:amino acid transporter